MKVRDLKTRLEDNVGRTKTSQLMTSISHWVKAVFDSPQGRYRARTINDIETLEKLAQLDILILKKGADNEVVAELSNDGRELYRDFMALGYYL